MCECSPKENSVRPAEVISNPPPAMPTMEDKLEEKARARQERERLDELKLAAARPSAASQFW